MADTFGGGLGGVIGGVLADNKLHETQDAVNATAADATGSVDRTASNFVAGTAGYDNFGKSFLDPATNTINEAKTKAGDTQGYNQFMSGYTNTPAAQYQLDQANAVQNNSAAARGGLLAGSNLRQLATIDNGIVSQNANTAYNEYLQGNNQQFGQLQSVLGNMFSAIGVGQTATGQQEALDAAKIGATASIANGQMGVTGKLGEAGAKNDQGKGSGMGSMFSNIGSAAFMF